MDIRTADSPWLAEKPAPKRNIIHTRSNLLIPTSNDNTGRKRVLILITDLLEDVRDRLNGGAFAILLSI